MHSHLQVCMAWHGAEASNGERNKNFRFLWRLSVGCCMKVTNWIGTYDASSSINGHGFYPGTFDILRCVRERERETTC